MYNYSAILVEDCVEFRAAIHCSHSAKRAGTSDSSLPITNFLPSSSTPTASDSSIRSHSCSDTEPDWMKSSLRPFIALFSSLARISAADF